MRFLSWRLRYLLPKVAPFRLRRKLVHRTLCVLTGGLGDKLMGLPGIRHIRASSPDSEMTLIVTGLVPPFFSTEADHVISLPSNDVAGLLRCSSRGFDTFFVNALGVFKVRFEAAAFVSGAREMYGPRFERLNPARVVYNHSYVYGFGHETAINLKGAGSNSTAESAEYLLQIPSNVDLSNEVFPDIIFHPGSSESGLINRWALENYAFVARELKAKGFSVLAVGTPAEAPLLQSLIELAGDSLSIRTDLSLETLALYLSKARLVIANDSGIGHLAASVGASLITIMGATRPGRVGPVGKNVTILGSRCEYGGCYNDPSVQAC